MQKKFNYGNKDLATMMRKAGRRMPRRAHRAADRILSMQQIAAHPRLSRQLDYRALKPAFRVMARAVRDYDPAARRIALRRDIGVTLAFGLFVALAVTLGMLYLARPV